MGANTKRFHRCLHCFADAVQDAAWAAALEVVEELRHLLHNLDELDNSPSSASRHDQAVSSSTECSACRDQTARHCID